MPTVDAPDRQTMWIWTLLAVLGALLAVAGWWRWAH